MTYLTKLKNENKMTPSTDLVELKGFLPLSLVLSLAIILHVFIKAKPNKSSHKLPPRPPTLPIIGNLHQLGKLAHQSLFHLSQKYGPIMLLQLGNIQTLVVSSPELAKQVMKTHDMDFFSRPDSPGGRKLSYDFSDVAFSPYNDQWSERRKLFVSHLFNSKKNKLMWDSKREVAISKTIKALSSQPSGTINFDEKMFKLVGEIVTSVAFGSSNKEYEYKGRNGEVKDFYREYMDLFQSFSAMDFFPSIVGKIIDSLSGHCNRVNKSIAKLDAYLDKVLQDHIDNKIETSNDEQQEDLVDILIRLSNRPSCFNLTTQHIKAMLTNIFIGGIDTSAVTIVWAMTELMRNRRVMNKVQEEIRSCVGRKDQLDEKDVADLKYFKMVLKETFRLHPAAPLLVPRETRNITKLQQGDIDYHIDPKTRVFINGWAIGRDPEYWKNPNEFYPERFEGTEIDSKGAHFQLIPFGAGRRICPGLSVSTLTIELILANLLHFFNWELPDGMKEEDISLEEAGLTVHREVPLMLKPIKFY